MKFFEMIQNIWTSSLVLGTVELPFTIHELFFRFVLPTLIFFIVYKIFMMFLRRILERSKVKEDVRYNIIRWVRFAIRLIYAAFTIIMFSRLFGAEIYRYLELFYNLLSTPFFESGTTRISLITLILMIPVFYFASWVAKLAIKFLNKSVFTSFSLDDSKRFTITSVVRYGIIVIIVIIGLSVIGINLSSLAVLFGVLGIGVGFGLQGVISNFFSGIVLLFTQPIKEGDRILVQDSEGAVVKIRLLSSTINTLTNESIIIPNSQLINNQIYNYSYEDRRIIILNTIQVSYEADLDNVIEVLKRIALENPYGLRRPEPIVRVAEFQDSGILMKLFTWVRDVTNKYESLSWTNLEIWREFKKEGISIPYPQMDVHLKKE